MKILFQRKSWYLFGIILLVAVGVVVAIGFFGNENDTHVTTTVTIGTVEELVSVSGFIEATNQAELGFPATGKVTEVFVDEGSVVETGEALATLASSELLADRAEAVAALELAEAQLDETVAGPTAETQAVSSAKVSNAEQNLARVSSEQAEIVKNARVALLSTGLEALATNPNEDATAPTISGTYTCLDEGTYVIDVYPSNAESGYSYTLSGLGRGTKAAFTDQPSPLDGCGLFIQFTAGSRYGNSTWEVEIPNTRSSSYVTNRNAYELALEQQENAIAAAEDALTLAREEAGQATATARGEVVSQRQAAISQARARIASIDARLADRSIVAPFPGIVTNVDVLPGETVTTAPVIELLADDTFELTARIPEIDITKIATGQAVEVVFDAKADERLTGTLTYISPVATEIDGVAYFETTVGLDTAPDWIRSGLNADLDIIIATMSDTPLLPKRFITSNDGQDVVLIRRGDELVEQPVEVIFTGNDGFVAIDGLEVGETVIAP